MVPDSNKITETFLVANSFLVAALGTADTNVHKAIASLLGLVISALWWLCSREAMAEIVSQRPEIFGHIRLRVQVWLPVIFVCTWMFSMVGHMLLALHILSFG